jgi:hypothetical protein
MNYNLMLCLVLLPIKFLTKLISILGSTNSGSNNVRLKPFSASIFTRLSLLGPTATSYRFEPRPCGQANMGLDYPSASLLWKL